MADLKISTEELLPEFVELLREVGYSETIFANTLAALHSASHMMQEVWIRYASGTPIPGAPRIINSRTYAESIQLDDTDPWVKVVYTDNQHHTRVEKGREEVDLKPGLLSGPKARQGKYGPYNVVPFRHMTPGAGSTGRGRAMPANVYRIMQKETKKADKDREAGLSDRGGTSRVVRSGKRPEDRLYEWGFALPDTGQGKESKQLGDGRSYTHRSGRYAGMTRMDVSTSAARRSHYMTFRTVSVRSDPNSWIIPKQDPIDIRGAVVDRVRPIAQQMLADALERDLST